MYGTVNPLAFKTPVIPTLEADADPVFQATRVEVVNSLLDKGIFEVVPLQQTDCHTIYISRFVHEIKVYGTLRERVKSRFVLCVHGDWDHSLITHAPTVQRESCRIVLSTNSQQPDRKVGSRDITQAFA